MLSFNQTYSPSTPLQGADVRVCDVITMMCSPEES